ncbi:MAG: thiolase family protein [Nitrospirae bacterium]|nr:thiolase family protein [Nitrospirota bacterium]
MVKPFLRDKDVVLVSAARTPIGSFQGALRRLSAPQLGAIAVQSALSRCGVQPADVSEVYLGHVLSAGCRQAPARQVAHRAGLPDGVGATTINKVCGSGLKAVMIGATGVAAGVDAIVVAGGMESMSRAPFLLPDMRTGLKLGNSSVIDSLLYDGLTDAYSDISMGICAERTAVKYGITREEMDDYARQSYERANQAHEKGWFDAELVPISTGSTELGRDEEPLRFQPEKLAKLAPAFARDGQVTAANSSSINDGAAAVVLMSGREAVQRGLTPLARVVAQAGAAHASEWFTTITPRAIERVLGKASLSVSDVDLFEINEAFAVVPMVACRELGIPPERVNVNGGAVALGHPIGASGARILVTLLHALRRTGGRYGVASVCIGGGEAVAMLVERLPE